MIKVLNYVVGQLQTNCYLLQFDKKCLIVDPGDEATLIADEILRRRLEPVAIIATHGHFDHVMVAGELQISFNIPLYINYDDLFLIKRLKETSDYYLKSKQIIILPSNTIDLRISSKSLKKDFNIELFFTPGHTPGGTSFYLKDEEILFTGDVLFKEAIGRYDFSYSNKNDLRESVKKIVSYPNETKVYPGHGEFTSVNEERKNISRFF